jgi:hypothetical protein
MRGSELLPELLPVFFARISSTSRLIRDPGAGLFLGHVFNRACLFGSRVVGLTFDVHVVALAGGFLHCFKSVPRHSALLLLLDERFLVDVSQRRQS